MAQYTYLQVKQLFMELFCTTRTGIADPTIRHVKRSTLDGETGYWVAEEETGDEGFVSLYIEDEFWVLSAKGGYNKRRVFSRRFKQGKGKGKGSQRKRPGFRPRSQKKGKGYLADDQFPDDQTFYGKKGKKGGKKGGKKQKDSFKSSKKGKTSKGDSSSSSGKANMAGSSPSEEHVDATESTAAGQDAWSEDYYWDSNYGCWVYFEQWDNQHESWNYFVHDGANTVGGAMPLPWDLPLVGPLAEPVGVTPDECLEEPLGGRGVRGPRLERAEEEAEDPTGRVLSGNCGRYP
eukprot:symbB.v1.2.030767.t1/scaffold3504.1/size56522/1